MMKTMELNYEYYSTMSLERLIDPAVTLAEGNTTLISFGNGRLTCSKTECSGSEKIFVPKDNLLKEGDRVKQPDFSKTLKIIREKELESVNEGKIADFIIKAVQNQGGVTEKTGSAELSSFA